MTLRTSPSIILEDFYIMEGKVPARDFQMSSLNSDSILGISVK